MSDFFCVFNLSEKNLKDFFGVKNTLISSEIPYDWKLKFQKLIKTQLQLSWDSLQVSKAWKKLTMRHAFNQA